MLDRLSTDGQRAVKHAESLARRSGSERIGTRDLLLAVLECDDREVELVLGALGSDAAGLVEALAAAGSVAEAPAAGDAKLTGAASRVLGASLRHALTLGDNEIGPVHLLTGLASSAGDPVSGVLTEHGLDSWTLREQVARQRDQVRREYFASFPVPPSDSLRRVLLAGIGYAASSRSPRVGLEHLLLALSRDREIPMLGRLGLDEAEVLKIVRGEDRTA